MVYLGDLQWLDLSSAPGPLDWVAFGLGGLGIGFTIYQLLRSKGALKSAELALNSTRKTLMTNQLVALLPRIKSTMENFEATLRADSSADRDQLSQQLADLMDYSAEAAELLSATNDSDPTAEIVFINLRMEAETMRAQLYEAAAGCSLKDSFARPLRRLRTVVLSIHSLSVRLRNDPGVLPAVQERT